MGIEANLGDEDEPGILGEKESRIVEAHFRKGATQGAQWLRERARSMASDGRSSQDIAAKMGELLEVLLDWRNDQVEMPDGNPWEWRARDLERFIDARKGEW